MPSFSPPCLIAIGLFAVAAVAVSGCGPAGLPQAEVSGKVTFQGQPVADVLVTFTPERGPGALGKTDADGNYSLMTKKPGDGAVIGRHVVSIKQQSQGMILEKGQPPRMAPPPKVVIPPKFAENASSGLSADVKDEENVINFDLSSM